MGRGHMRASEIGEKPMSSTPALSAPSAGAPFDTTTIERRELGEHDVLIDIKFCGICHSDIHQVKDEWGGSIFPMVPGHEIAGVVAAVGSAVRELSIGERVGVGCMGGLGHVAVQIAAAMGAEVTVLSQTLSKREDGLRLGAKHYYATSEPSTF